MCGHDFGTEEATTLEQVNNRLVLTCCEEAGSWKLEAVQCGAVLGGLGEEPEGLINEPYLQEQRHRQRAHTLSARG